MLTPDDSRDDGWIAMKCRNHPNLRWTRKDPDALQGCLSQAAHLMFDGDITRPHAEVHPFVVSESQLRTIVANRNKRLGLSVDPDAEVARYQAEGFVFECECSYFDLEYIRKEN